MTTVPALTDEATLAQYVATGGQTDFNFSYMIFATADIEVYVNGVLKTETTDYTVKKSGGGSISASDLPLDGGKVVFVSGLTADDEVSLNRNIAIARLTGYSVAGAFRADVVNAEFTKALAISQQLRRDVERAIRLAAFDSEGGSLIIPTGRAGNLLGFDLNGDLELVAGTIDQLNVSSFAETLLDDASAIAARITLGLEIGVDVQAHDSNLDSLASLADISNLSALAGLSGAANKIPYFTGAGAMDLVDKKYQLGSVQIFTSSGTWTKPAGCIATEVFVLGGGGGSGGAQVGLNMGEASGGGGGGGSAYKFITSGLGSTETVTIGDGGTAGTTSGNGGTGGTSSFGAHCSATGGAGSVNASGSNATYSGGGGGAGGTGSGGTVNLIGSAGQNGSRSYSVTGLGGNGGSGAGSFGGGGAVQQHVSSTTGVTGVAATANTGGGASGASADYNTGTSRAGAAGGSGLVVVKEYY